MGRSVVKANCKTCGKSFTASSNKKVYCTDECRRNKLYGKLDLSKYLSRGKITYAGLGEL